METKSVKNSVDKQTFFLAVGKIAALIANFAIPIFLTRMLSKDDYGFYSQFNTVLFFLVSFFSFTMSTNLYYFYPTVKSSKKKIIIFQSILFLILFGSLSAIFIYLPGVDDFILGSDLLKTFKNTIYFLTIFLAFISIIDPLYVVKRDVGMSIWFPPLQIILKAVFIIMFFIYIPTISSVINAIIISTSLVFLIALIYIYRTIKKLPGKELINSEIAMKQLQYNLPIGFALSIKVFAQRFDKLISITLLSASSYASYTIAFFGIPGIGQIYSAVSQVTVIDMTKSFSEGNKQHALQLYKDMVVKNLSFSIPLVLIVALNAKEIIKFLFTDKYLDATILFQMYLITIVFSMLGEGLILRASGDTKIYMKIYALILPVTLPLSYYLVSNYGTYGAMSGALISVILPRLLLIQKEIRVTESKLSYFFPWKRIRDVFSIALLCLIPFLFLKYFFSFNIYLILIASFLYLLSVYAIELKFNLFIIDLEKFTLLRKKYFKI